MMKNFGIALIALCAAILSGCATPTVVQAVKPGDNGLTCAQLQNEYVDAERFRSEAEREKTVTGGNVARALLFWPAILGTAANANEAIAAADIRKVHLANQMNQRNCAIPTSFSIVDSTTSGVSQLSAETPQSREAKLRELKRLFDADLISRATYEAQQKVILESQTRLSATDSEVGKPPVSAANAMNSGISFWNCSLNGRLKFKDGSDGCLENYPDFMNAKLDSGQVLGSFYKEEQYVQIAVVNDPVRCPFAIGVTSGFTAQAVLAMRGGAQQVPRCQVNLERIVGSRAPHCRCQDLETIAGSRSKQEFAEFLRISTVREREGWKP